MSAYSVLIMAAAVASAWDCPSCGLSNEGPICRECFLPQPPAGMVWVAGDTITTGGATIEVRPFFIDTSTVTYRRILPWLNQEATSIERLAQLVSGQFDENLNFLRYTPFTGNEQGTGLTVPSACLDLPACSITRQAAIDFLASEGSRLPTAGELALAARSGLVGEVDIYTVMSPYAAMMESTMGSTLGGLSYQAMFAGYGSDPERVLWEWTIDTPSGPGASADPCAVIYRRGGTGIASIESGYFNVAFRGAVTDPSGL